MAGEQYGDLAIASLLSFFGSNLAAQLRIVETAQGLSPGDLPDPNDFVAGELEGDPQALVFQVFVDGTGETLPEATGINRIVTYPCVAHIEFVGDAGVEAGKLLMRRYLSAMVKTLAADRTLGELVVMAIDAGQDTDSEVFGDSESRHGAELLIDVTVHETS